jgi:hypothetical protein
METTPQSVSPPPEAAQYKRYCVQLLAAALLFIALIGVGNYLLDPWTYSHATHRDMAAAFEQGKNVAIYDPNLEFRGLRRAHIRSMTSAPDVLLFAGSRLQEATPETLPFGGVSFYNAFVHNDYSEDYLGLSELLIQTDRLPKLLVLSVRYKSFMPISARDTEEWKSFAPEARAMAERLGVPPVGWLESYPFKFWGTIVSLPKLGGSIARWWRYRGSTPGITDATTLDDLDVLHHQGPLAFSKHHLHAFSLEGAREDARKRAKKHRQTKLIIDPVRLDGFIKLLDELRRRGVRVAIAMTPHHPLYWKGIAGSPFGDALARLEQEMHRIGPEHGAVVVGSYDAERAGCSETMFTDYIHYTNDCLTAVFRTLPNPNQ